MITELTTARLRLRGWRDEDRAPLAAMGMDPEVMEFFPGLLDRAASDAMFDRIVAHQDLHGFGLWAVEIPERGLRFAGFVGIVRCNFDAHFTPAIEVGWRLCRPAWGGGYATEGGQAALAYGFDVVGADEIVSLTSVGNRRSRAVMERLGMHRDPADDFDHPRLPSDHPLGRHVLYRLRRDERTHQAR
jgi:ribosomal-protein-alanine N-acetyltransferase